MKFYEVAPNLAMTEHAITIRPICFSGKTFKTLPPDLQAAILKAGKEAGAYGRQIESSEDAAKLDALEKAGKLKRVPFKDRAEMKKLVDPVMAAYAKEIGADAIFNKIDAMKLHELIVSIGGRDALVPAAFSSGTDSMNARTPNAAPVACGGNSPPCMPSSCPGCSCSRSAILVIPVSLQIFSRYTELIPSYIWTEEMARFLFIWTIMIGAMIGVRESTHFEVDVWPQLSPRGRGLRCGCSGVSACWRSRSSSSGRASNSPNSPGAGPRNWPTCRSGSFTSPGRSPA